MKKEKLMKALKQIPIWVWIVWGLSLIIALVQVVANASETVADTINGSIAAIVRAALAYLFCLLPLSLAELLLISLPLWILLSILLVKHLVKRCHPLRIVSGFLSLLPFLYILFTLTLGMGYAATPLADKMGLSVKSEITAKELLFTAERLKDESQTLLLQLEQEEGNTSPTHTVSERNRLLIAAYESLAEKYAFVKTFSVGVKPILLSRPMAYTGITGVYSFFTGEANLNTSYPAYSTWFTAAHEMAHARGFSRENEANFVAFLALYSSEDTYVRYVGCINLLQYVMNALSYADQDAFLSFYQALHEDIRKEYQAYYDYVDTINDHPIRHLADVVNDAYLKGVGTEGTLSYGLVVELAVAFYRSR